MMVLRIDSHDAMVVGRGGNAFESPCLAVQCRDVASGHVCPASLDLRHESDFEHTVAIIKAMHNYNLARTAENSGKLHVEGIALYICPERGFESSPSLDCRLSLHQGRRSQQNKY